MGVECLGAIDLDLLERAVRHAISEADSHFLNFVDTKDGSRQYLRPLPNFSIPHLDFSRGQSPHAAALAWMRADRAKGFDLARGPLFRNALIKVAEDHFFLYGLYHHLIIDLFGGSLLTRRCGEVYSALAAHQTPPPSELVSSLTLLEEEESYRGSRQQERDRNYWHAQLENRPEVVTLSGKLPGWPGHMLHQDAIILSATIGRLEKARRGLWRRLVDRHPGRRGTLPVSHDRRHRRGPRHADGRASQPEDAPRRGSGRKHRSAASVGRSRHANRDIFAAGGAADARRPPSSTLLGEPAAPRARPLARSARPLRPDRQLHADQPSD
jgi:hypothetical protein